MFFVSRLWLLLLLLLLLFLLLLFLFLLFFSPCCSCCYWSSCCSKCYGSSCSYSPSSFFFFFFFFFFLLLLLLHFAGDDYNLSALESFFADVYLFGCATRAFLPPGAMTMVHQFLKLFRDHAGVMCATANVGGDEIKPMNKPLRWPGMLWWWNLIINESRDRFLSRLASLFDLHDGMRVWQEKTWLALGYLRFMRSPYTSSNWGQNSFKYSQ